MAKGTAVSVQLPVNRVWNGRSDLRAGVEIYHWGYPGFWLILSSQNDPLLGPDSSPPCGQLAAPYLYAHLESNPIASRALRYRP